MVVKRNKFLHESQTYHFEQKKSGTKEYIISNALQRVPEQVGLIYSERNPQGQFPGDGKEEKRMNEITKGHEETSGG